ncbi:protein sorting system archaetidylserine decarboxylase [Halarchaeum sp. CBA1220]|uniref:protein sorting system archaetidylserine decarboxylase n=1 Tax=Halarchaeum sp. CBA1220 TaxID=1853682 RepID=UPI000F3A8051|nr:protein sorting system archaetidylserine decarboxylase [Halarchaeum sp. CBA1220]QLC33316.1 protein sorting system archaetidylserine decarboxylase [Halarchaeum sp. CBA1220]
MRLAPGARTYAVPPLALAIPGLFVFPPAGVALAALGCFVLWFHRDPEREVPDGGVVAPADGRVSVRRVEDGRVRVGVFMNVTDVHVNRAPAAGVVASVDHRDGAHRPAFSKESERNERVRITTDSYELDLIAGAFARRIHPYVEPGDTVARGERVGHVSFGSRADVLLPPEYDVKDVRVAVGDTVRAGETVIA